MNGRSDDTTTRWAADTRLSVAQPTKRLLRSATTWGRPASGVTMAPAALLMPPPLAAVRTPAGTQLVPSNSRT
jgi:hypothetical protein